MTSRMVFPLVLALLLTAAACGARVEFSSTAEGDPDSSWADGYGDPAGADRDRGSTPLMDHPRIGLFGGAGDADLQSLDSDLGRLGALEVQIGYAHQPRVRRAVRRAGVGRYDFAGLFFGALPTSMGGGNDDPGYTLWRGGIGGAEGYAYRLDGGRSINLHHGKSIFWSDLELDGLPAAVSAADLKRIKRFDGHLRFGMRDVTGMEFPIVGPMGVDLSFERAIINPRTLFWQWLGAAAVEEIGRHGIDRFTRSVLRASPRAAPIVSLLLHGGLSYGLYELRRDRMNWPFDSEEGWGIDVARAGLTFTF